MPPEKTPDAPHEGAAATHEHTRTGMSKDALNRAFVDNLFYVQGRFREVASPNDLYMAAAYTVRDRLLGRWIKSAETYRETKARTVCYLSAEFLLGPHLLNNLVNLGSRRWPGRPGRNWGSICACSSRPRRNRD